MGPGKNTELFEAVGAPRIAALNEEHTRRDLVSQTLQDLSELFEKKNNDVDLVTEPTLFARLYALSMMQRSQMSITGFSALEAVDMTNGSGEIKAKAGPYHDEFTIAADDPDSIGSNYRTRIIKIELPPHHDIHGRPMNNDDIVIFGINLYQPLAKAEVEEKTVDPERLKYIAINPRGRVVAKGPEPINGETVVFAVLNKMTGDAKAYTAKFISPDSEDYETYPNQQIVHKDDNHAIVLLPDANQVAVSTLKDIELSQAISELLAGANKIEGIENPDDILTDQEKAIAQELAAGATNAL